MKNHMFLRRSQPGAGCLSAVLLHGSFHLLNTYCTSATGLRTGVALGEPSSQYPAPSHSEKRIYKGAFTKITSYYVAAQGPENRGNVLSGISPATRQEQFQGTQVFSHQQATHPRQHWPNPARECRRRTLVSQAFSRLSISTQFLKPLPRIKQKLDFLIALISRSYLPLLCPCSPDPQGQPRTVGETLSQN